MGKVIKKKLNGMNWWMKTSLVLLLTIATSMFMYQGWYLPKEVKAATATYYLAPTAAATSVGLDGNTTVLDATVSYSVTQGTTNSVRASTSTTTPTATVNQRIQLSATATSALTKQEMVRVYTPAYAASTTISASIVSRVDAYHRTAGAGTVLLADVFEYNDISGNVGAAKGTGSVAIANSTTGATYSITLNNPSFTVASGNRVVVYYYFTCATGVRPAMLYGASPLVAATPAGLTSFTLVEAAAVTDSTPPVNGTISVSPDDGATYTSSAPTISMGFTDPDSTITGCQYSIDNGTTFATATWTAGTGICSQALTGLANTTILNMQMKATSAGGTSTPAGSLTRTVDTTGPTDGTFTVTAGNGQNVLTWTAATPTGSALHTTLPYDVRYLAGATAPASCTAGTSIYNGTALTYTQTGLTNGTTHSYRVCADDVVGNASIGQTGSGTPAAPPADPSKISTCTACHFNPTALTANAGSYDGPDRGVTKAGLFQGSHNKHANTYAQACTVCHTNQTDYGHANGTININATIATAGTYSRTNPAVSNTFTPGLCNNTYCHSNGTSVKTGAAIAANTSPNWGQATNCGSCHGILADNGRPNYANGGQGTATANTHGDGAGYGTTHKAQACTICHSGVTGTPGAYVTSSTHADGTYNLVAGVSYNTTNHTCTNVAGCHAGGTVTWGGSLACLDCHTASALTAPNASSISSGTVTQRRGISTEFGLTSNHTRSRGTVTSEDCGVCHMEGNPTDGSKNTNASTAGIVGGQFHGNGVIELRDPDTGAAIIAQSWSQALPSNTQGAFANKAGSPVAAFVQFSRNLATRPELETALVWPNTTNAGLYPSTTNTRFEVNSAIQKQHCLGCHDAAGAAGAGTGASASKIPTGSALNPFAATITTNGMTASLRVLDVKSQLESTNRSYHPVLYKQNNGYAGSTRMVAPWNNVNKTGTTTVFGPLITCWDCHAGDGATTAVTVTTTHGGALAGTNRVPLRGQTNVASTTSGTTNYCLFCHLGYTASDAGHAAGSAFVTNTQGTSRTMTGMSSTCTGCHSSIGAAGTKPARPYGAADAHGYDVKGPTAAVPNGAFAAGQGYAFIRANTFYGVTNYQQRVANVGGSAYVPLCAGATTTGGGFCGRADMGGAAPTITKAYDPGGSF